jgi:hypothetical protein
MFCQSALLWHHAHKPDTLLLKAERNPAAFPDKAEIVGPNEIANNRVGDRPIASGDIKDKTEK